MAQQARYNNNIKWACWRKSAAQGKGFALKAFREMLEERKLAFAFIATLKYDISALCWAIKRFVEQTAAINQQTIKRAAIVLERKRWSLISLDIL